MKSVRRSDIELFHTCPHAFYLSVICGIAGKKSEWMDKGIEGHKAIEDSLKSGVIPDNCTGLFTDKQIGVEDVAIEKTYEAEYQGFRFHAKMDLTWKDEYRGYICDHKFISNEYNERFYYEKLLQPEVYSYLYLANNPDIDEVEFMYWFPEYSRIIDGFIFYRRDMEKIAEKYILPIIPIIESGDYKPNFAVCDSCNYREHCQHNLPDKVETAMQEFPEHDIVTAVLSNPARAYMLLSRIKAVAPIIEDTLKEELERQGGPIDIGDGQMIDLTTRAGKRSVQDGIVQHLVDNGVETEKILAEAKLGIKSVEKLKGSIDVSGYIKTGNPSKILTLVKK